MRSKLLASILAGTLLGQSAVVLAQTPPPAGDTRPKGAEEDPNVAQPPPPPPPKAPPPGTGGRGPMSAEEKAEFDAIMAEVEDVAKRWENQGGEHLVRMKEILRREYDERVRKLNQKYASGLKVADEEFRKRHLDAIAQLKEFLAKYPDDPKWTPDAMFRLADLYLDEAKWEFDKQQEAMAAAPADVPPEDEFGDDFDPDAEVPYLGPNYNPSVDLWREIVQRFPSYRQADSVVYLLAYYYGEMRRTAESKQAYLGLVCRNKFDPLDTPPPPPDPNDMRARLNVGPKTFVDPYTDCEPLNADVASGKDLVDESWVRIGEAHFDTRGELNEAIAAYKRVVADEQSKFYEIATYKLAWSYYRNNQFMEGIQAFDKLVVQSDRNEDEGKPKGDLRPEAVKYIAISFADVWEPNPEVLSDPVKSIERINQFYKGRFNERHVRDVYEELGDAIRIQAGAPAAGVDVPAETKTAYLKAIEAWRTTIDNYPLHPRNPIVHKKIIDAYAFIGDTESALRERRAFAELYAKGSKWYAANETNREAMDYAQRQGELAILDAARNIHRQAFLARKDWRAAPTPEKKKAYLDLYETAAKLYSSYLEQYPTSNEVYGVTYDLAECYFFGEQYQKAVPHYRWVRDHRDLGDKFKEAADSIVKSWEAAVEQAKQNGQLVEPPVPTPEQLAANPAPMPVPTLYLELQAAYDEYIKILPDETAKPKSLASAMIEYRHLQLDRALARFQKILDEYCTTEEAVQAKDGILAIYQARGEHEKFRATNEKFIANNCGTSEARRTAELQNLSNEYLMAKKAFDEKRFADAGLLFYQVYKASKEDYQNKAAALFNAGLAFNEAGMPKTAIAVFEEFVKIPGFKDSEFYVEAMFLVALSYQKAFDYDRSVDQFLEVAELAQEAMNKEARGSKKMSRDGFNLKQARIDALFNAAVLRDLERRYYDNGKNDPGAATLYKRYAAADDKDLERAARAYFDAGVVYEKAGNVKEMQKTFAEFRKSYAEKAGKLGPFLTIWSYHKTAKALEKARDKKGAEDNYRATIRAFDQYSGVKGSAEASLAAEAQFWLAEQFYKSKFEPYKVAWKGNIVDKNPKKAEKAVVDTLNALKKISADTAALYSDVARFETGWSLAASVRLGDIAFFFGQKLLDAPVPKDIIKADNADPEAGYLNAYQTQLEELVRPQTLQAQDYWEKAVKAAKDKGISDEWSKLAQQRLNAYIASDLFPVLRDEMVEKEVNP